MKPNLNVEHIKKIWILDLIVKHGSFKKAALDAKVSPSAVSQSLTALERSLGKRLIIRERGSITATPEALALLLSVRPAFEIFSRLENVGHASVPSMTWLNFGTYESIAVDLIPKLLLSLRATLPDLRIGLRISRTAELMTMVRKGELCSAIVTETDEMESFEIREIAEDRLGVFISRHLPAADLGWDAVENLGLGTLAPGKSGHPRYFTHFLKSLGTFKTLATSDSFETLRSAACAGALAAILPHRVAGRSDDLIEVTPHEQISKHSDGRHRIVLISEANCDVEEIDFLAKTIQPLICVPT